MCDMLGVREKVVEQVRNFFLGAIVFVETLDPLKSASRVNIRGGLCASASNALA